MIDNKLLNSGTLYSDIIDLDANITTIAIGLSSIGTAVATVDLQVPVIYGKQSDLTDNGWINLTAAHGWDGFPAGQLNGNFSDSVVINNLGYPAVRLKLTHTSGSSLINARLNSKINS